MDYTTSVALVTGANRGLGREFTRQLLDRGAKVYAAARDPEAIDVPGAIALRLDVTDAEAIAKLPEVVPDVTFVVNNAGMSSATMTQGADLVTGDLELILREQETNVYGPIRIVRALAPTLAANGGGAILNVLSRLSWHVQLGVGSYSMSKAALWMATNSMRLELAGQGTHVGGLVLSGTDTDMMAGWDGPLNDPADVVALALDGIAAGECELLADADSVAAKAALSRPPEEVFA